MSMDLYLVTERCVNIDLSTTAYNLSGCKFKIFSMSTNNLRTSDDLQLTAVCWCCSATVAGVKSGTDRVPSVLPTPSSGRSLVNIVTSGRVNTA